MALQITPESYSDVILTEEEVSEALRIAREAKHVAKLKADYMEKIRSQPLVPKFSAEEMFEMLLRTHDRQRSEGHGCRAWVK